MKLQVISLCKRILSKYLKIAIITLLKHLEKTHLAIVLNIWATLITFFRKTWCMVDKHFMGRQMEVKC